MGVNACVYVCMNADVYERVCRKVILICLSVLSEYDMKRKETTKELKDSALLFS